MYPIIKFEHLIRDECNYKGCRNNEQGKCLSVKMIEKTKIVPCDYNQYFECRNYELKAIDICLKCGGYLNLNPQYDMWGEVDKICPNCSYGNTWV